MMKILEAVFLVGAFISVSGTSNDDCKPGKTIPPEDFQEIESKLFGIDTSWLMALLVGFITFYLVQFYLNVRRFPHGPFAFPIIGSVFVFLKNKENISETFNELSKKYNGIYTVWAGSVPFVFVANWELCKEALVTKRNDVKSRPYFNSFRHSLKHTDAIVLHGNTKHWEVCRKVGYSAVRKLSDSKTLANIVHQNIQDTATKMLAIKGPFNPKNIIENVIFDIFAQTAFGAKKLEESDAVLVRFNTDFIHETMAINPGDFIPILAPFFRHLDKKFEKCSRLLGGLMKRKFQEAKTNYDTDEANHFASSIIWSKNEADKKDSGNKQYLTDDNMKKILGDLFLAGTDTSTVTLQWVVLALAQFPQIQERTREEIQQNIGKRMPEQEDRLNCPYTRAFISELLRLRSPAPMMFPHATNEDTELGGHKIPKRTTVIFDTNATHFDPNIWEEPEKLKPERFLDADGKYAKSNLQGYLAFGKGKRHCIGEKMARNYLFLAIANLLQKIKIYYVNTSNSTLLETSNNPFVNLPKNFEIVVQPL